MPLTDVVLLLVAVLVLWSIRRGLLQRVLGKFFRFGYWLLLTLIPILLLHIVAYYFIFRFFRNLVYGSPETTTVLLSLLAASTTFAAVCFAFSATLGKDDKIEVNTIGKIVVPVSGLRTELLTAGIAFFHATIQFAIGALATYVFQVVSPLVPGATWIQFGAVLFLLTPATILFMSGALAIASSMEALYLSLHRTFPHGVSYNDDASITLS